MSAKRSSILSERAVRAGSVCLIACVGAILAIFELWHTSQMQSPLGKVVQAVLPLTMALVIIAASYGLYRSEIEAGELRRITSWFVAGLLGMSLMVGWIISHQFIRGMAFHHWQFVVVGSMTVGGSVGLLIGVYDAYRRIEHRAAEQTRQAVAASRDGMAILTESGEYEQVNQAHAEVYGYDDPAVFIGRTFHMCYEDAEAAHIEEEILPTLSETGSWRGELTGLRRNGETYPQEITFSSRPQGGYLYVVRDISERAAFEQQLITRELRLRTILENMPIILFVIETDRTITLQVGKGLEQVSREQNQHVGSTVADLFGAESEITDAIERSFDGAFVDVMLEMWGRTYQVWVQPVTESGEITSVIAVAMDVTERHKRERGISALNEATRAMMQELTHEEISQIAVLTAQNALNLSRPGIWLQSDDKSLKPVAWAATTDVSTDDLPTFTPENGAVWEAYESGEIQIADDIGRGLADTDGGELIVPLGELGVLVSGSSTAHEFDETDLVLAQLLVANTRTALERATREKDLQRQTEQMEFFNSILRHDVLNGMTVIRSRAEFLVEDLDADQSKDAETIINWSNNIIGIVRRVRTILDTLNGNTDPNLEDTHLSLVLRDEVRRIKDTYPEVEFETDIPDDITVFANELLGEVFGNVLTNAINHNDADGLRISVTAAVSEDRATVHIADNGRGIPDDHKERIFRRDETGHAKSTGSGFGLFFVDSMVAEYGGSVSVEDNVPNGVVFVIELPLA
ncbi:ATP-binding protein [Haladaptatus sp. CMSO5]|uniref:ATP-binding protein n=1 Tax=Haladaptatus sp. CMSO5 TaxID=3120514 RepID=UPI002FCE4DB8